VVPVPARRYALVGDTEQLETAPLQLGVKLPVVVPVPVFCTVNAVVVVVLGAALALPLLGLTTSVALPPPIRGVTVPDVGRLPVCAAAPGAVMLNARVSARPTERLSASGIAPVAGHTARIPRLSAHAVR